MAIIKTLKVETVPNNVSSPTSSRGKILGVTISGVALFEGYTSQVGQETGGHNHDLQI